VKLIYLTMNNNVEYAQEALEAGASAFVLKNALSSELLKAIRDALRGVSYVAPEIRQAMAETFIRNPEAVSRPQHLDRQREVLQMLAEGHLLGEIASLLRISYRTVRFHKLRILEELDISNNAELVKYAMNHGMISPAQRPLLKGILLSRFVNDPRHLSLATGAKFPRKAYGHRTEAPISATCPVRGLLWPQSGYYLPTTVKPCLPTFARN
jgi:DNA-binding CsgD family transcriptional regulator